MAAMACLYIHRPFDDQAAGSIIDRIELTERVQAIIDMGYASVVYLETEPVASKMRTRRKVSGGESSGVEQGGGDRDSDASGEAPGSADGGEDLRRLLEEGE